MNINELDLKDETIKCSDCGEDFTFRIGEQRYFISKSLSPPKRCQKCRAKRKNNIVRVGGDGQ